MSTKKQSQSCSTGELQERTRQLHNKRKSTRDLRVLFFINGSVGGDGQDEEAPTVGGKTTHPQSAQPDPGEKRKETA